uniref:Rho-GAP domain-containing protein n=1 Tax=Sphenodon punctatus TaxID=8508 RepID=A0A8D0HN87_SPHPU
MNAFNLALCIAPNMLWLPSPTGPEEESESTKKVAMLVQFLIENSPEIFGGDIAALFQRPDQEKSKSIEDLDVPHQDSSDEMEFAAPDQGRPKRHHVPDTDAIFGPSSGLLLDEEQEDWDLFSEIAACYQSKSGKNASADSYDLLEEEGSFCSIGSIRSLSPARDRCSSEPSVCLSSQLPTQCHEPVARQSSCDATIMHNHVDYIHRLKQLQLESQKLIDEGLSPGVTRTRQSFWRSPQSSTRVKKLSPQKTSLSNRSSFSSLSSTTTSPSASSLSSLDSAFSYCSESSAFSPTDISSLPFMFGTSARLHALSPMTTKKSLKEWNKPLTSPLPLNPCDLDLRSEQEEKDKGGSHSMGEGKGFKPISWAAMLNEKGREEEEKEMICTGGSGQALRSHCYLKESEYKADPKAHIPANGSPLGTSPQVQREKSVKHIEIKGPDFLPSHESLKRTKITVYMAPNKESPRGSPVEQEDTDIAVSISSTSSSGSSSQSASKSLQTVRVHIPQTVFYGQNTPLVLQSVSRRFHHQERSPPLQAKQKQLPQSVPPPEEPRHDVPLTAHAKSHSKSSNTFKHTIRIILPAAIRNTVRDYFKHDEARNCHMADTEAVEDELIRSRAEWLQSQLQADTPEEECNMALFAEETFV